METGTILGVFTLKANCTILLQDTQQLHTTRHGDTTTGSFLHHYPAHIRFISGSLHMPGHPMTAAMPRTMTQEMICIIYSPRH